MHECLAACQARGKLQTCPCPFPRRTKWGKPKSRIIPAGSELQQSCSEEKRLGHFTVSSKGEQIAAALHDHRGGRPERGLCLPRGELEWHGLAAPGGMWSGLTGTAVAWEAVGFAAGPPPTPRLPNLYSAAQLW